MINLKKILKPDFRRNARYLLTFVPDKAYLQLHYLLTVGRFVNFKNPKTYTEKLQWLKLNDQRPEYSKLVDKLAVRDHIDEVLGEGHLFPLLGVWDSFDDIDFDCLPEQFVLKCNHDSGSTRVIKSKSSITPEQMEKYREHFNRRVGRDYYYACREYPYKGLPHRIIAEAFMVDESAPEKSIEDYKFFCFNGEPKIMFVATDRDTDVKFDFFDMDFNHLDIENIHAQSGKEIQKPVMFEEMKEIAAKLSQGMRQVRIDLYELNGKIYFGEYTIFHGAGFGEFKPREWEERLGDWIDLN